MCTQPSDRSLVACKVSTAIISLEILRAEVYTAVAEIIASKVRFACRHVNYILLLVRSVNINVVVTMDMAMQMLLANDWDMNDVLWRHLYRCIHDLANRLVNTSTVIDT